MREIWFDTIANPTVVDIVLQVLQEIIDLDFSTETLQLNAVLDIAWVDKRLDWSGNSYNFHIIFVKSFVSKRGFLLECYTIFV